MAQALIDRHGQDLRYIALWGHWRMWDGVSWHRDETLHAQELAREVCRDHAATYAAWLESEKKAPGPARSIASAKAITATERIARSDRRIAAGVAHWDADPWLLNTPGGIVDLRTGKITPCRREAMCASAAAVAPDFQAKPTRWLRFLDEVFSGDAELIAYVQRALGYALTGNTGEHCLFFFWGEGRNGKGTLLSTVAHILGEYHRATLMETFAEARGERHPTELADLMGARLITANETEQGRHWAESRIKMLTGLQGEEQIAARFMRGDLFRFKPVCKLIISGNHKPRLKSIDVAIRERIKLVPFTVSFKGREDRTLADKLIEEAPAILAWMIEGCLAWQEDGLRDPRAVQEATEEYFAAEDAVGRWIEECCTVVHYAQAGSTALWDSWKKWADANGEHHGTQRRLSEVLAAKGFERYRTKHSRGFKGINLEAQPYREQEAERGEF